ncbi:class I SAM-dependent DNA methyltransferase [Paenibacillus turpanensis]|uniref:class I SAM-dependent DNA methyltransferase n=1 Tax=Paenibacillus turpanensis TaxID=2689078 RepID=UPI00140721B8|nr:class I SAM-dependent methyltransferase [Paenibacillus turpanensis]
MSASYTGFADVYDRLMEDMPYGDWVEFALQVWDSGDAPGLAVDLGCGTGNVSIPLAQLGWNVTGIDLSPAMINVARRKAAVAAGAMKAAGGSAAFEEGDMRSWAPERPADFVFSFCDCLNYLRYDRDVRDTFRAVYEGLAPGGRFVFDLHHPSMLPRFAEEQPFLLREEEIAYLWTSEWDGERSEISHELTFFIQEHGGFYRRVEEKHIQRAYEPGEIIEWLRASGFDRVRACADFSFDEVDESTERMFFIAYKP